MSAKIVSLFEHHAAAATKGIDQQREQIIRGQARDLLVRAWRAEAKRGEVELSRILPIEPRWVLSRVFPSWQFLDFRKSPSNGREIGVLDRLTKTIQVSTNVPSNVRRFTGAHELGHHTLHKFRNLRESPLDDKGISRSANSLKEREANLFAAELLMPSRLVRNLFLCRFGYALYRDLLDDEAAFFCSNGGDFSLSDLQSMSLLEMAKVISESEPLWTADSRPFTQIFGVSATAMAIQLMNLGLIGISP